MNNKHNLQYGLRPLKRINVTPRGAEGREPEADGNQMPTINPRQQQLKQQIEYHVPDSSGMMPGLNKNLLLARQMIENNEAESGPTVA